MNFIIPELPSISLSDSSLITDRQSFDIFNEFIPLISLTKGTITKKEDKRIFSYNLSMVSTIAGYRKFDDFCNFLKHGPATRWQKIKHTNLTKDYYGAYGSIIYLDEDLRLIPLMLLCVKRQYLYSLDKNNPDHNHLCLLVDRKFYENEENYKLYRNVNKYYILDIARFIDVHSTNDILNLCYNSGGDIAPKYNTVMDMVNDMKAINEIVKMEFLSSVNS